MPKFTLASYNRFLGESISKYGFSRKEAAEQFRAMKSSLGHSPFRSDLKSHPRIAARSAREVREKRTGEGFKEIKPAIDATQLPPPQKQEAPPEPFDMEFNATEDEGIY